MTLGSLRDQLLYLWFQLLILWEGTPQMPEASLSFPNYRDYRDRKRSFASVGAFREESRDLRRLNPALRGEFLPTTLRGVRTQALSGPLRGLRSRPQPADPNPSPRPRDPSSGACATSPSGTTTSTWRPARSAAWS